MQLGISPDAVIAMSAAAMDVAGAMTGEQIKPLASRRPAASEMEADERLLDDAVAGNATSFAREDYVDEAWRHL